MSPEDAAAVAETWHDLRGHNTYADTYTRLIAGIDDLDQVPDFIVAIIRNLPRQWGQLAEIIVATGAALEDRQAEADEAFAGLVQTMTPDVDLGELLRDDEADS